MKKGARTISKQPGILAIGLIILAVGVAGCTSPQQTTDNQSEAVKPIDLVATPMHVPSGELKKELEESNRTFTVTIKLKTADVEANVLSGNQTGKLILIGKNVSIPSKTLWKGTIKKNMNKSFNFNIRLTDTHASLTGRLLVNGSRVDQDVRIIESSEKPKNSYPEGVEKKHGIPAQ